MGKFLPWKQGFKLTQTFEPTAKGIFAVPLEILRLIAKHLSPQSLISLAEAIPKFLPTAVDEIGRRLKDYLGLFMEETRIGDFHACMDRTGAVIIGGVASCVLTENAQLSLVYGSINPIQLDILMPYNEHRSTAQWRRFLISVGYEHVPVLGKPWKNGDKVTKFLNWGTVRLQPLYCCIDDPNIEIGTQGLRCWSRRTPYWISVPVGTKFRYDVCNRLRRGILHVSRSSPTWGKYQFDWWWNWMVGRHFYGIHYWSPDTHIYRELDGTVWIGMSIYMEKVERRQIPNPSIHVGSKQGSNNAHAHG